MKLTKSIGKKGNFIPKEVMPNKMGDRIPPRVSVAGWGTKISQLVRIRITSFKNMRKNQNYIFTKKTCNLTIFCATAKEQERGCERLE